MNENLKNLLARISEDEDLRAKFEPIAELADKRAADEALVALAAEADMPLTAAELEPEGELELDELDAVAGGEGTPDLYREDGYRDELCWCTAAGSGACTWETDGLGSCPCVAAGDGN